MGNDTPFMRDLTEDPRFHGTAQQMHGDDVILAGVDGNRYTGDTGWHPDHGTDRTKDCFGVKMAFYLEPLDETNGCLRLVLGRAANSPGGGRASASQGC
jgi:hypothetical protein